jgi:hypothetical protein
MSRQILNGWKEISNYIRRSVRTVQRWEARLGLPVYRPALKDRSAVVAFSDELDRWISRASPDAGEEDAVLNGIEENDAGLLRMLDNMSTMALDTAELSSQMRLLQEQLRQSLRIYHHRIASKTRAHTTPVPSRDMGSVLSFRPRQGGLPLEDMVFRADAQGMAGQRHGNGGERAPGHSLLEVARHKG